MAKTLYFDIESHNAGRQYGMAPHEFFRLGQYAWDDGPVAITTDYDEMIRVIREADYVVGHNVCSFDLSVLFGVDSMESLLMARDRKVIDTYVVASLVAPPPYSYTNPQGRTVFDAAKPENAMSWLSLENLCHQFGLPGKFGSLKELAKKHNPPKTLVANLDFSLIPLDDPEFLEYAEQDVIAVRGLWKHLKALISEQDYDRTYIWREMLIWSINAQITRNGWLVDREEAESRVAELAEERDRVMAWLVERYDFPTEGKSPWASAKGKEVILKVLAEYGVTEDNHPDWPRTPTGALKLGGKDLIELTEGAEAETFGRAMATLKGQRSLAQLALDSTHPDGRVHPEIACLQRSGRTSVQRPGLTVWTARGDGAVEKRYFVADPGEVLVEMDFAAADARVVAAVSGDLEFAKRFEPGADAHEITGRIFFADEYDDDPAYYRNKTKPGTHGMSYRIGARKLAATLDVPVEKAKGFLQQYAQAYPWVTRWQNEITQFGESHGYVQNSWGRRMTVDEGRSFTQSSALIGQSSTRELLFDGLIRIVRDHPGVIRHLRATVHDAIVWSFPRDKAPEMAGWVISRMESTFDPGTNVSHPIHFPMACGPLDATNWYEASHE